MTDKCVLEIIRKKIGRGKAASTYFVMEQPMPEENLQVGNLVCNGVQLSFRRESFADLAEIELAFADLDTVAGLRCVNHFDSENQTITPEMLEGVSATEYDGYTQLVEIDKKQVVASAATASEPARMMWQLDVKLAQPPYIG